LPTGPIAELARAGPGLAVKSPVTAMLEASKPIAFNINFARITGDAKAALFLSQLVYWTRRGADVLDNNGWVFKTREAWEAELGLSKHEQATARNTLTAMGLIEEARTGAPARNCYRVMPTVLGACLAQLVRSEPVQWSLLDIRSDNQNIRQMLGRQFAFYRVLMQITASRTSAIYLSKALAIQRRFADRQAQGVVNAQEMAALPWDAEWFRMAVDSTQAETGLSPAQQRDAKHKLCQLGLMHEAMMTHPRKQIYLRIDMQMLNQLLINVSQKSACQNRTNESEPGSDQSGECGISAKRMPVIHLATLPQLARAVADPGLSGDPPGPADLAACHNRTNESKSVEDGPGDCGNSGKRITVIHLPTLPQLAQTVADPGLSGDPPEPLVPACQNRTTRMTDSDNLDGRFSQGRWPVLARPMAGFSTPSGPVLAGLHAHASRVRQDYKEDYKETTTTHPTDPKINPVRPIAANSGPNEAQASSSGQTDTSGPPSDAVVVVASSEASDEGLQAQWIWPEAMTRAERDQGSRILLSLAKTGQLEDAQHILDELSGCFKTPAGVKFPVAYLRKLVAEHQTTPGGLVFEKAHDVRLRREGEHRQALFQAQLRQAQCPQSVTAPANGPVVLSEAAKEGLAKAREMLAALKHSKGSS